MLTLDAPGASPERLTFALSIARAVFEAAGVDPYEAWNAVNTGVHCEAASAWRLAEMAGLAACPGESDGELALIDA
jgi:hypothetical protein